MLEYDGDMRGEGLDELPRLGRDGVAGGGIQVEAAETRGGIEEQTQPYPGAQSHSDGGRYIARPPLFSAGVLDDHDGVTPDRVNAWPLHQGVLKVVKVQDQLARGGDGLQTTFAVSKRDADMIDGRHRAASHVNDVV